MASTPFLLALLLGLASGLSHAADNAAAIPQAAAERPAASPASAALERAHEHYEAGHWADAFEGFASLADCGHREAARIALQMRQFGPHLYGRVFMAGPRQLQRWRALVARDAAGNDVGCAGAPDPARKASQPASSIHRPAVDPEREPWRHQGVG